MQELPFPARGGQRKGAGRKRVGERPRVSHKPRPKLACRHPVLVTVRVRAGLPSLRRANSLHVLERAFAAGSERFGFRLIHYSVQSNHLHLIAEAHDEGALARGMKGLLVRITRGLNRHWRRSGALVDDHYHARALKHPREVRHALVYVLQNARRHGVHVPGPDPFSSARGFDGWEHTEPRQEAASPPPVASARTWLLTTGWRRHGLIGFEEHPARPASDQGSGGRRRQ